MAFQPHSFMFQPQEEDHDHHHHHHQINLSSNPNNHLLHAAGHEAQFMMMKRSLSFSGIDDHHHHHHNDQDDVSDDGSQSVVGEKKKRLSLEQVKTLEKSFEVGNKVEPERKVQLAKALGLQPRQVAIWFQNRRARWKTKQLEKDYELLRKQFDLVKADNHSLHAQNKKLHDELSALRGRDSSEAGLENCKKDQGDQGSWSNGSDQNSSDKNNNNNNNNNINLEISRAQQVMNNSTSSASSQLIRGKNLFPSNLRPSSITQLPQGSSRSDLQCLKVDHPHQIHQLEENFCNVLVNGGSAAGVEADHHQSAAGFWPWPEQHYFH